MTCETVLPEPILVDGTVDVITKFKSLSTEALATDSIYMRAKDTFKELLDGKKINADLYAKLAGEFASQLATVSMQQTMQGALQWAEQEKTLAYTLAKSKADTGLSLAQRDMVGHQICQIDKETELKCAQVTATVSGSIRDNGRVATRDVNNPCIPLTLQDEGVKFDQKAVYQAQTYTSLADAYRKSGVVTVSETTDGVTKGTAGDNLGYTNAQEAYARRQILSFEDSKRNHAANAASQMIGQLLAQELTPANEDLERWRSPMDYLNTNTVGTADDSYFTTTSKNKLFTSVLDAVAGTAKDTTIEIVAIQGVTERIIDTAGRVVTIYPAIAVADFTIAAITGVNTNNLSWVLAAIGASDHYGFDIDTVVKLQVVVDLGIANYAASIA